MKALNAWIASFRRRRFAGAKPSRDRLIDEVMIAAERSTAWVFSHPPPDQDALAQRWGGLSRIPVNEWEKHERAIRAWQKPLMKQTAELYAAIHAAEKQVERLPPASQPTPAAGRRPSRCR
jgi:hypothetical protein